MYGEAARPKLKSFRKFLFGSKKNLRDGRKSLPPPLLPGWEWRRRGRRRKLKKEGEESQTGETDLEISFCLERGGRGKKNFLSFRPRPKITEAKNRLFFWRVTSKKKPELS